jgi:hypothetical protein
MDTDRPWVNRFLHHVTVTRQSWPAIPALYTSVAALCPDLVAAAYAGMSGSFSPAEKHEGTENKSCIMSMLWLAFSGGTHNAILAIYLSDRSRYMHRTGP